MITLSALLVVIGIVFAISLSFSKGLKEEKLIYVHIKQKGLGKFLLRKRNVRSTKRERH